MSHTVQQKVNLNSSVAYFQSAASHTLTICCKAHYRTIIQVNVVLKLFGSQCEECKTSAF